MTRIWELEIMLHGKRISRPRANFIAAGKPKVPKPLKLKAPKDNLLEVP